MPTSGFLSAVPPNHAATNWPGAVSTMVDAWHAGNGAVSKINSDLRIAPSPAGAADNGRIKTVSRTAQRTAKRMAAEKGSAGWPCSHSGFAIGRKVRPRHQPRGGLFQTVQSF